jgi:hypothetical protein
MTLQEFKAWFDGFTENMSETPTKLQWDRIKSRVKGINNVAVTYPVLIDRYWPNIYPHYIGPPLPQLICNTNANVKDDGHTVTNFGLTASDLNASFNSTQAMHALGTNEYSALRG